MLIAVCCELVVVCGMLFFSLLFVVCAVRCVLCVCCLLVVGLCRFACVCGRP